MPAAAPARAALALLASAASAGGLTPDRLSSPRRQCSAVTIAPEHGGLAIFAGGYTHGQGNAAAGSSGKAVDMFDASGRRVSTTELAIGRGTMGAAVWRDAAFFGGGQDAEKNNTDVVDIFNVTDGSHRIEHLSQPRAMVAGATVGDLVLFAGGELAEDESGQGPSRESKRVDIYDARQRRWVAANDSLSVPRKKTAAATAGGRVIFAGGYSATFHASVDTWDMLDSATGRWSSGRLSSKRMRLQAVSLTAQDGTEYALFIGGLGEFQQEGGMETCPHTFAPTKDGIVCGYTTAGLCTTVDIYNSRTDSWSYTNLTRGRYEFSAVAVGFPKQDAVIVSGGKQGGIGRGTWSKC